MTKPKGVVSTVPLEQRPDQPKKTKGIRVTFDRPIRTNRPLTVYKERIINPENNEVVEVLWYPTEQGQEVGRIPIYDEEKRKMNPDDKTLLGYEYTMLATPENIAAVKKEAFGRTQFAIKDGDRRYQVSIDAF